MSDEVVVETALQTHDIKVCSKCHVEKTLDAYRKDKRRKDGFYPQCKDCEKEYRVSKVPGYGLSGRGAGEWLVNEDGNKRCCRCHQMKNADECFHKNRARPDGYHHYCKECSKAAVKESDQRHPASKKRRMRKTYLKRRYGLTPEQFDLMVWEQNNKCAICYEEMDSPHVDQDANVLRALLCGECFDGLNNFNHSTELLLRGVSYLDSYTQKGRPMGDPSLGLDAVGN